MNHYILIHRLTGPAILLLLGIVALLSEMHLVHFFIFVPLLLILLGVLKLAERAALTGYEFPGPGTGPQQPGANPYGAPDNGPTQGAKYDAGGPAPTSTSIFPSSIVPTSDERGTGSESSLSQSNLTRSGEEEL